MGSELQTKYQKLAQEYAKVWHSCDYYECRYYKNLH